MKLIAPSALAPTAAIRTRESESANPLILLGPIVGFAQMRNKFGQFRLHGRLQRMAVASAASVPQHVLHKFLESEPIRGAFAFSEKVEMRSNQGACVTGQHQHGGRQVQWVAQTVTRSAFAAARLPS